MASLSKVRTFTRKVAVIGIMIFAGLFLLLILFDIGRAIKDTFFPTPPPAPTVSFGKLPPITFPNAQTPTQVTYSIETLSGNLPTLPDRTTVYKMEQANSSLLDLQNMQDTVTKMGYDPTTQQQISDTVYQWTNTDELPKTLAVNIVTKDFTLTSDFQSLDASSAATLPGETGAISFAQSFLGMFNGIPSDINTDKTKASLFSRDPNGNLTPATSYSDALFIRVDFFQKDIQSIPIYYPQPTESLMNMLIAGGNVGSPQVVQSQFIHKTISNESATYPLKTSQEALSELKSGNAYMPSPPLNGTTILLRNVSLGYYIGDYNEPYLMPVIVFQGDNGFFAYVSAVANSWISN